METCPKCGTTRQPADSAPDAQCPGCGVVYAKFRPATPDSVPPARSNDAAPNYRPVAISAIVGLLVGLIVGHAVTAIAGLVAGAIAGSLCLWILRVRRTRTYGDTDQSYTDASGSSPSSSGSSALFTGAGGLLGGAGASGLWDSPSDSSAASAGDSGGSSDSGGGGDGGGGGD
jgi:hypothetical protein